MAEAVAEAEAGARAVAEAEAEPQPEAEDGVDFLEGIPMGSRTVQKPLGKWGLKDSEDFRRFPKISEGTTPQKPLGILGSEKGFSFSGIQFPKRSEIIEKPLRRATLLANARGRSPTLADARATPRKPLGILGSERGHPNLRFHFFAEPS